MSVRLYSPPDTLGTPKPFKSPVLPPMQPLHAYNLLPPLPTVVTFIGSKTLFMYMWAVQKSAVSNSVKVYKD
jgi:hypothetical protein